MRLSADCGFSLHTHMHTQAHAHTQEAGKANAVTTVTVQACPGVFPSIPLVVRGQCAALPGMGTQLHR